MAAVLEKVEDVKVGELILKLDNRWYEVVGTGFSGDTYDADVVLQFADGTVGWFNPGCRVQVARRGRIAQLFDRLANR